MVYTALCRALVFAVRSKDVRMEIRGTQAHRPTVPRKQSERHVIAFYTHRQIRLSCDILEGTRHTRTHARAHTHTDLETMLTPIAGTEMRRLTTWIRSEKCVVRRFRRCANVIILTQT